jgi:hypothetical protein
MITTDEILARMRNGESADNIADEMAQMLNLAQKELAKEQATNQKEIAYKRACEKASDAVNDALDAYAHWKDVDMSEYMWNADTAMSIIELLSTFGELISLFTPDKPASTTATINTKKPNSGSDIGVMDFENIVEKFLRDNNIK